jgi:hypothetical protein
MAAEDVITLGIGSAPADLTPFILVGLNASNIAAVSPTTLDGQGSVGALTGTGSGGASNHVSTGTVTGATDNGLLATITDSSAMHSTFGVDAAEHDLTIYRSDGTVRLRLTAGSWLYSGSETVFLVSVAAGGATIQVGDTYIISDPDVVVIAAGTGSLGAISGTGGV